MTTFETAVQQWREGERRIAAAPPEQQPTLDRVTDAIVLELRKRLGSAFTSAELVDLYDRGTPWAFDLAVALAPTAPWAWEQRIVADAAFSRYLRDAVDYAGGRLLDVD